VPEVAEAAFARDALDASRQNPDIREPEKERCPHTRSIGAFAGWL
jgi:hypothetical protein